MTKLLFWLIFEHYECKNRESNLNKWKNTIAAWALSASDVLNCMMYCISPLWTLQCNLPCTLYSSKFISLHTFNHIRNLKNSKYLKNFYCLFWTAHYYLLLILKDFKSWKWKLFLSINYLKKSRNALFKISTFNM